MLAHARPEAASSDSALISKALVRAADRLEVTNKVLARIIGVSEATVSRLKKGDYPVERGQTPYQLAVLFIRLYRSLAAVTGAQSPSLGARVPAPLAALNVRRHRLVPS